MNKKLILVFIVIILLAGYLFLNIKDKSATQPEANIAEYSSKELGLSFDYRTGPDGYVIEESKMTANDANLLSSIVLIPTKEANIPPPVGGEGPATITINVFKNTKKQFPRIWADENIQYSNINLKMGDVSEIVVGGANAIRYTADGLYASDNVVVAHGENIYILSGMYIDIESSLRKDFSPIVESVKFIPQANQE